MVDSLKTKQTYHDR